MGMQAGHLMQGAANSAAQIGAALGNRGRGRRSFSGATLKENLGFPKKDAPRPEGVPLSGEGWSP